MSWDLMPQHPPPLVLAAPDVLSPLPWSATQAAGGCAQSTGAAPRGSLASSQPNTAERMLERMVRTWAMPLWSLLAHLYLLPRDLEGCRGGQPHLVLGAVARRCSPSHCCHLQTTVQQPNLAMLLKASPEPWPRLQLPGQARALCLQTPPAPSCGTDAPKNLMLGQGCLERGTCPPLKAKSRGREEA